jgi:hypothetical protein
MAQNWSRNDLAPDALKTQIPILTIISKKIALPNGEIVRNSYLLDYLIQISKLKKII